MGNYILKCCIQSSTLRSVNTCVCLSDLSINYSPHSLSTSFPPVSCSSRGLCACCMSSSLLVYFYGSILMSGINTTALSVVSCGLLIFHVKGWSECKNEKKKRLFVLYAYFLNCLYLLCIHRKSYPYFYFYFSLKKNIPLKTSCKKPSRAYPWENVPHQKCFQTFSLTFKYQRLPNIQAACHRANTESGNSLSAASMKHQLRSPSQLQPRFPAGGPECLCQNLCIRDLYEAGRLESWEAETSRTFFFRRTLSFLIFSFCFSPFVTFLPEQQPQRTNLSHL